MGQFSLLAVIGAFLLSGVVVYNASRSAGSADEKVWEHQYQVIARDAASTGMSAATRRLGQNLNTAWSSGFAATLAQTNVAYNSGTYTVTATANASSCPLLLNAANYSAALAGFVKDGDVLQVRARGDYAGNVAGDAQQSHEIIACFMKADYGLYAPPAFNYGFISNDEFNFNGGPDIQALVDGEGHVHSNNSLYLGPKVVVDGHATYVNTGVVKQGAEVASAGTGLNIPMKPFNANDFKTAEGISQTYCAANPSVCRYDMGFTAGANTIVKPTDNCAGDPNCVADPFIWFIDGNFTLGGSNRVQVPQYTTIVVTGNITISGSSSLTVTGVTLDQYCVNTTNKACNKLNATQLEKATRDWVTSQLFDGEHSPIAWYGEGKVDLDGTAALVGNFYVNGNVTLNGGGQGNNTIGSFASAQGDVTANGGGSGGNFWFLDVAQKNVIDGVKLPGKQIVRLALAEWTDPVLDH